MFHETCLAVSAEHAFHQTARSTSHSARSNNLDHPSELDRQFYNHWSLHKSRRDDLVKPGVITPGRDDAEKPSPGGTISTDITRSIRSPLWGWILSSLQT